MVLVACCMLAVAARLPGDRPIKVTQELVHGLVLLDAIKHPGKC